MHTLKPFWRAETGIFLCLWLVLMIGGRSRFLQDPGTFWHTVVGDRLINSRELMERDSFTFTFAGQPWIPHQWLGECLMALVNRLDGLDSLLLATVTVLTCLYTWLAHRLIRAGLHWSLAAVVVGLTIAASSSHFHIRPHIGTIVLLGCTYAFLCDFEAGRMSVRRLAWLVPLFMLWTNIHGGMLGGLCTVILAAGGWCLVKVVGGQGPIKHYQQLVPLAGIVLACGLTAFVNPYGWRLPWTWVSIMHSDLPTLIEEHAPLNFAKPDGVMVLVFGLVYLATLASIRPRRPRITWLLPLVWFCLACTRVRHAPLFSITAAIGLADMLPHTRLAAWMARPGSDWFQYRSESPVATPRITWKPALLPALVLVTAVLLQAWRVAVPVVGHDWARLDPRYWPVELLTDLHWHEYDRKNGTPIFNEYLFGGFLIGKAPGYRVFVDDRCELYGDAWLRDYVQAEWQDPAGHLARWQQRYGPFNLALTRTGSGFDRCLGSAGNWMVLARTETATLYQRKAITAAAVHTDGLASIEK